MGKVTKKTTPKKSIAKKAVKKITKKPAVSKKAVKKVTSIPPLHAETPLLHQIEMSHALQSALGKKLKSGHQIRVLCKMDCVQPSGSFKIRGIGRLAQQAKSKNAKQLISSSGGNAGMAAAYAAFASQMQCQIVVPSTTPKSTITKLQNLGATVTVHGDVWNVADQLAQKMVKDAEAKEPGSVQYVHPYEHPVTHQGHSTIIDEIKKQMQQRGIDNKPSAVVCCVGGGGLLSGILLGLKNNGWSSVPVIAAETIGAESFNLAMEKGKPTVLAGGITSIAKSLGSTIASSTAVQLSKAHPGKVYPVKVTDKAATDACLKFADQQRCLVEPACGAALAAGAYDPKGIRSALEGIIAKDKRSVNDVVVIACGGNSVNRDMLEKWRTDFNL